MNNIENNLQKNIEKALHDLYELEDTSLIMIEIPRDNTNGDYSTNIAMRLAKVLRRAPQIIAKELSEKLTEICDDVEKIDVAGPGFINFWMKKTALGNIINQVLEKGEAFGENESGENLPILIEYVSANPTGDLHAGHARGAVWGDSICRLLKKSGYDVLREYYINDAGAQMLNLGKSVYARYAECFGENVEIPEDGYMGEDVKIIGQNLAKELGDEWLHKEEGRVEYFRERGYEVELEKIKRDLKNFGCEFDSWISERSFYESGRVEECIEKMREMGLTYDEDGATWFRSTKWGDDKDRVIVKADGSLTYLTPDIANHIYKFERGYKKLVNLWGADHHGYIPRMKAAMMAFGHEENDLEVDIIQMVRLIENGKEVKMSKRTGNAITLRELMEDIGVDAARYFFLSKAVDTHLDLDLTLARKKTNENPVYYVQYAHARICSVLSQAPKYKPVQDFNLLTSAKETDIIKYLGEFTSVVADAAKTRMPNKVCNYVYKLAGYFHSFYGSYKVIDPENMELTNQRIGLLMAVKDVLASGLDLLGVSAPEKM